MNGLYIWQNIFQNIPLWVLALSGLAVGWIMGTIHRKLSGCENSE